MLQYADLLKEKTRIRLSDPERYEALTLITAGAASLAKKENREVVEADILSSVRSEIKKTEGAIELILSKNGDVAKFKKSLDIYSAFLPVSLSREETEVFIQGTLNALPPEQKDKKNMGKLIALIKQKGIEEAKPLDMKTVSAVIAESLK